MAHAHPSPTLPDSAAAAERAGQWRAAIALYERAARQGVERRDPRAVLHAILYTGNCYRRLGEAEIAQEHFELALLLAERLGDDAAAARALNGLGTVHQQRGEMDVAERRYRAAREHGGRCGDPALLGVIDQNLGTLSTARGRLGEAVAHFRVGLARFEEAGHTRGCAEVLNNLGDVYALLGRHADAAGCLERALRCGLEENDAVTTNLIRLSQAELFLAMGETERARDVCRQAFEACCRLEHALGTGEALRIYGMIVRAAGESQEAESMLRQAIGIAQRLDAPLLEAEAHGDLALALRAQGRNREALGAFNRSHVLFQQVQARHREAEIDGRLAQLERDFLEIVQRWGESIEAKDRYTGGHCARVAGYACRIAAEAALDKAELVWFRMGAYLHDVGKTCVPDEILNKPGRLSPEEWVVMRQHAVLGEQMIAEVEFPWDVGCMVRSHHERWDGGGYPDGLSGERIPLPARILCIADVFDALTTTRSYHAGLPPRDALAVMEKDARAFDPRLFALFRSVYPELCTGDAAPAVAP